MQAVETGLLTKAAETWTRQDDGYESDEMARKIPSNRNNGGLDSRVVVGVTSERSLQCRTIWRKASASPFRPAAVRGNSNRNL